MKFPQCLTSSKRPLKQTKHNLKIFEDILSNPWECSSNRGLKWWWLKMMACFYLKQKLQNMFFLSKTPQRFPCFFVSTPGFSTPTPQHLKHPTILVFARETSKSKSWKVNCETLAEASILRGVEVGEANSAPWNEQQFAPARVAIIPKRKRESLPTSNFLHFQVRTMLWRLVSGRN